MDIQYPEDILRGRGDQILRQMRKTTGPIVVGVLGRGKDQYAPYPIFILCALLTWKHFSGAASGAANVLKKKVSLIKAVPFPTMILPLTQVISGFCFFCFGIVVLIIAAQLAKGENYTGGLDALIQLPGLMALQIAVVAGIALPLACLGALIRDLGHAMAHLLRLGFYISPGLFSIEMVRDALVLKTGAAADTLFNIYMLNPFAILITGYRCAVFEGTFLPWHYWLTLLIEAIIALVIGYKMFQYYDRRVIKFL